MRQTLLFIMITFLSISCGSDTKVEEKKCVEETYKEIKKAIKEFGDAETNSIDEIKLSISTFSKVLKEINLNGCPSDYKLQVLKMQDELNSILTLVSSGERGKATAEKYQELTKRNGETGEKIEELAASYGVNVDD